MNLFDRIFGPAITQKHTFSRDTIAPVKYDEIGPPRILSPHGETNGAVRALHVIALDPGNIGSFNFSPLIIAQGGSVTISLTNGPWNYLVIQPDPTSASVANFQTFYRLTLGATRVTDWIPISQPVGAYNLSQRGKGAVNPLQIDSANGAGLTVGFQSGMGPFHIRAVFDGIEIANASSKLPFIFYAYAIKEPFTPFMFGGASLIK